MAYVFRYTASVEWTDGAGLGMNAGPQLGGANAPLGATIRMFNTSVVGSTTFTNADINSMVAAMQTDLSTQMLAQQPRVQAFATGGG